MTAASALEPLACQFPALGTTVTVVVAPLADGAATERALLAARAEVADEVDRLDRTCSRFRSDSELVALNAGAGQFVNVSDLLLEAIEVALRAAALTDGRVDPTVGEAMRLSGYDRDFALIDADGPPLVATVRPVPGWRLVQVWGPSGPLSGGQGPSGPLSGGQGPSGPLSGGRARAAL